MALVYAEVELINGEDLVLARLHMIGEDEIRSMPVNILVDTGAYMLAINESIQEQLQLPVVEKSKGRTGQRAYCGL
jgi:predicted aspartyl protease